MTVKTLVVLAACGVTTMACSTATSRGARASSAPAPVSKAAREVAYYEADLAKKPTNFPTYAQLGRALLDRARETHDPALIGRARLVLQRSLDLQPNYEALVLMAAVANFGHRFEEGKRWAEQALAMAQGDSGPDPYATALLVEAHLGLGDVEAAGALLPKDGKTDQFHIAGALGQWYALQDRADEALAAYAVAIRIAREQKVPELEAWANVVSAGVYIDGGRAPLAKPFLEAAAKLHPESKILAIHQAEVLEAAGRDAEALAVYERLLERDGPDAELGRLAYGLAKKLGRTADAERHLRETERVCLEVIQAGEVYTLGELAALWADAGIRLDQALRLAEENLRFKRDAQAKETLERLRTMRTGSGG